MEDDYIGVVAICGDEGTGKSSMSLTFPKPLRHLDTDVGSFRRAAWRLDVEDVVSKSYPKPIQVDKLLGNQGSASTRILTPKKVEGMKELWQSIVMDFVAYCTDDTVKTIVIDSFTSLWNTCHQAHLQELQEKQAVKFKTSNPSRQFDENDYRERLQPIEYGPANDRMRTLIHTARSYHKNLVLTHYPTDEYGTVPDGKGGMVEGKTGIKIMDGFKETVKLADLVVWLKINERIDKGNKIKEPWAKITKCGIEGMGLNAVGTEILATFESVMNLKNFMIDTQKVVS
jgi:hypothetical protein